MLLLICGVLKGKTRNTTYPPPHRALPSTKCGKTWFLALGLIILTLLKACIAFLKKEHDGLNADQYDVPFYLLQIKRGDDAKTCYWNVNTALNVLNMYGLKDWHWNTSVEYACVESLAFQYMCFGNSPTWATLESIDGS